MPAESAIRVFHTVIDHPRQAVEAMVSALAQPSTACVIFFISAHYDREAIAAALRDGFGDVLVIGCTTAGEIGPLGMTTNGLSGVSFSTSILHASAGLLTELSVKTTEKIRDFAQRQLNRFLDDTQYASSANTFSLLLIDGLSQREEPVASSLQIMLGNIPLVGGSAGDGLRFREAYVYCDGRFHADSAVFLLATTALPFRTFRTQHFMPSDDRIVVTSADASQRVVHELNGRPAAEEYAHRVGCTVEALTPVIFATYPVVVKIDDSYFVRSILGADADGSLRFYCAIEEGLVLRIAHGTDLAENLSKTLASIHGDLGTPKVTLVFDCILRRLEAREKGLDGAVADLLIASNAVGFNTYGEQYHGIHINQTFAAIAIGEALPDRRHE